MLRASCCNLGVHLQLTESFPKVASGRAGSKPSIYKGSKYPTPGFEKEKRKLGTTLVPCVIPSHSLAARPDKRFMALPFFSIKYLVSLELAFLKFIPLNRPE